jgi:hypothetical protein
MICQPDESRDSLPVDEDADLCRCGAEFDYEAGEPISVQTAEQYRRGRCTRLCRACVRAMVEAEEEAA